MTHKGGQRCQFGWYRSKGLTFDDGVTYFEIKQEVASSRIVFSKLQPVWWGNVEFKPTIEVRCYPSLR